MPTLLAVVAVAATFALVDHMRHVDFVLDSFTGAFAASGAFIAVGRLAMGAAESQRRLLWQFILVLFSLVALGEFIEPFGDRMERQLGIANIDDYVLLAVAPVALWFTSRLEPIPIWARRCLIVGFALQIVATTLDVLADRPTAILRVDLARIESYADLAQLLSMQCYLVAVFLTVVELKWRLSQLGATAAIPTRLWPPPFNLFAPSRYRNQTVDALRRAYLHSFWRSVSWWKVPLVLLAASAWPLAILISSLCRELPRHGKRVKIVTGRSYVAQLLDHLTIGLSANLWPRQYYKFELFRPELRPRAYEYLRRVETKRALYKLLRTDYREEDRFRDKLRFFRACKRADVRTVPVILAVADGRIIYPEFGSPPSLPPADLFIKRRTGRGGSGADIIRFKNGRYVLSDRRQMTEPDLIAALVARSNTQSLLVQPRLVNHPALAAINMSALSTVRVVTATETDGRAKVLAAALRVPSRVGSLIDNFHAGGIAAAVDLETGRLGPATDLGVRSDSSWHSVHPVTGARIEGLMVPDWHRIVELAETAHTKLADRIVLGWDIAVLADGPCTIEANAFPDLDICQRTMRAPLGNDRLGQLMVYHLKHH
ncbi:MAG: sugar-transfer associated ATP-grasp domain-containing protein [Dongiaceae bacterium]